MIKKYKLCPKCGDRKGKEILYGMPDLSKMSEDDILGGCVIEDGCPKYGCLNCGHKWGRINLR
jgi:hypothetical protein